MHWRFTRKRAQNSSQLDAWRERPDSDFTKFGVTRSALEAAQYLFQGTILTPWDPGYNAARKLSNPVFDPFPSIILMCVCENDVALALNVAWGGNPSVPFTVRSGGHCTAGFSAGSGLLIDISGLSNVSIDAANLVATVEAGMQFQ